MKNTILTKGFYLCVLYTEHIVVGPFASEAKATEHYVLMRMRGLPDLGSSVWPESIMQGFIESTNIGPEWIFTPEDEIKNYEETKDGLIIGDEKEGE